MPNKYDELIKKALMLYEERELSKIPPDEEIDHVFSEKYQKAKKRLLKKVGRPYYYLLNTAAKKAAVLIICFILACSSLLSVNAIREKIVDFFYKIYSTYTEIISEDNTAQKSEAIKTFYTIPFVPEGYSLFINDINEFRAYYMWTKYQDQIISFEQGCNDSLPNLNSENGQVVEKVINEVSCLCITQAHAYIYYWEDDYYKFILIYPADLGEAYAESVIGKLVEVPNPNE